MSELEDLLREELRAQASRPQADAHTMLGRVRAARRRGTLVAAGLAVLVLTAGVAVWLGRPAASLPPPASPLPASATLPERAQIWFADADHGYATLLDCSAQPCAAWLASTSDGGKTWQGHRIPDLVPPSLDIPARMRVLGNNTVVIDRNDGVDRWITRDSGNSWTKSKQEPQGTVEEIPRGAVAGIELNAGRPIGVIVLRTDGTSSRLAHPPDVPIIAGPSDVLTAEDGSAWIQGSDDDRCYVQVSRDRGRSWTPVPLPVPKDIEVQTWDGHTVYLVQRYGYRVWRSTDDGRHWTELTAPIAKPDADVGLATIPEPDGGLIVAGVISNKAFVIAPDADQFEPIALDRFGGWHGRRMIRGSGEKGSASPYYTSADGVTWTELGLR